MIIADAYDDLINCSINQNEDGNVIITYLLLSIRAKNLSSFLIGLLIYSITKPLIKMIDNGENFKPNSFIEV